MLPGDTGLIRRPTAAQPRLRIFGIRGPGFQGRTRHPCSYERCCWTPIPAFGHSRRPDGCKRMRRLARPRGGGARSATAPNVTIRETSIRPGRYGGTAPKSPRKAEQSAEPRRLLRDHRANARQLRLRTAAGRQSVESDIIYVIRRCAYGRGPPDSPQG